MDWYFLCPTRISEKSGTSQISMMEIIQACKNHLEWYILLQE